ncbi:MAG: ABC transporter ATP-binding protein [Planctomycetota bacterium]
MSLLEARRLKKSYGGCPAVVDVSFSLEPGEVLGLLGPNGAGKSTTMMMLAGLLVPDEGEVILGGSCFDGRNRDQRRLLGVVPQDFAIYPDLNAIENLQFFGRLYGLHGRELQAQCDEVLERIGLVDSASRIAGGYSGGMKRRLNFGVALMHRPSVLILDEPTVGVDPQSRSHLLDCVRDQARSGVGVIYASHYMEEVQSICQRVAIVDHGKVLAYDAIPKLLTGLAADVILYVDDVVRAVSVVAGLARIGTGSDGQSAVVLSGDGPDLGERLRSVLDKVKIAGICVLRVETQQTNLERLFLSLTGHRLRD